MKKTKLFAMISTILAMGLVACGPTAEPSKTPSSRRTTSKHKRTCTRYFKYTCARYFEHSCTKYHQVHQHQVLPLVQVVLLPQQSMDKWRSTLLMSSRKATKYYSKSEAHILDTLMPMQ